MNATRGVCRGCGREMNVTAEGKVTAHGPLLDPCPGSKEPPRDSVAENAAALAEAIEGLSVHSVRGEAGVLLADLTTVIDRYLSTLGLPLLGGGDA